MLNLFFVNAPHQSEVKEEHMEADAELLVFINSTLWILCVAVTQLCRLHEQVVTATLKQVESKLDKDLDAMTQWLAAAQDHCKRQACQCMAAIQTISKSFPKFWQSSVKPIASDRGTWTWSTWPRDSRRERKLSKPSSDRITGMSSWMWCQMLMVIWFNIKQIQVHPTRILPVRFDV